MLDYAILAIAAFLAGILNTIAGGGTFLTFPALVYSGIPPVVANATSAVAVFPGYLGGALGFHRELRRFERSQLLRLALITLAGGAVGSGLLLLSSNRAFSVIVPFLLLTATLVFLFGDDIRAWAVARSKTSRVYSSVGLLLVSVYGGYFNGGLGIVLLALFSLWGMADIHKMNALKNALSFALSAVSVAIFSLAGIVEWPQAILMMIAATIGGYTGAPIARALPKRIVRGLIVLLGFCMSAVFFWRLF